METSSLVFNSFSFFYIRYLRNSWEGQNSFSLIFFKYVQNYPGCHAILQSWRELILQQRKMPLLGNPFGARGYRGFHTPVQRHRRHLWRELGLKIQTEGKACKVLCISCSSVSLFLFLSPPLLTESYKQRLKPFKVFFFIMNIGISKTKL